MIEYRTGGKAVLGDVARGPALLLGADTRTTWIVGTVVGILPDRLSSNLTLAVVEHQVLPEDYPRFDRRWLEPGPGVMYSRDGVAGRPVLTRLVLHYGTSADFVLVQRADGSVPEAREVQDGELAQGVACRSAAAANQGPRGAGSGTGQG